MLFSGKKKSKTFNLLPWKHRIMPIISQFFVLRQPRYILKETSKNTDSFRTSSQQIDMWYKPTKFSNIWFKSKWRPYNHNFKIPYFENSLLWTVSFILFWKLEADIRLLMIWSFSENFVKNGPPVKKISWLAYWKSLFWEKGNKKTAVNSKNMLFICQEVFKYSF